MIVNYTRMNKEQLNKAFIKACKNEDLTLAKYLLESPELEIRADIDAMNYEGFRVVCKNKNIDFINYFIIERNLILTTSMKIMLYLIENEQGHNYISNLIKTRDLNNKLNRTLENKDTTFKRIKI